MEQEHLVSSAYPPDHHPQLHSNTHALLRHPYHLLDINIRPFQEEDLSEIINLHREWFPLNYTNDFYNRIHLNQVICKVAEATITQDNETKKILVGAITYEFNHAGSLLRKNKWTEYFSWDNLCIYLMTLGVIDEFRNKKVGKLLLDQLLHEPKLSERIKYIDLHVVAYNSAARFYEKNQFEQIEYLPNHYNNIMGRAEDAKRLVRFFNEGARRQSWGEWVRALLK